MENIYSILQKLHTLRQKSQLDSEHFEVLGKLIAARDVPAILTHITNKTKSGYIKSAYQKELAKLCKHYQVSSLEDAELRLKRLLTAIHMDRYDTQKIQEALDTGATIVVNEIYHGEESYMFESGISPLMAAIKNGNAKAIKMLIKHGANLDQVRDINALVNQKGQTILHISSFLQIPELTKMALERNANPNIQDIKQHTPLFNACWYNDAASALLLLKSNANPATAGKIDGKNYTPLHLTIFHKNKALITALLTAGYKVKSKELDFAKQKDDKIYRELKKPFAFKKVLTMFNTSHENKPHDNEALRAIFATLYVANEKLKADLKHRIELIYFDQNSILRPLLDLAALATQGRHDAGVAKKKQFKVFMSEGKHIGDLMASGEKDYGRYKGSNTVYVAGFHGNTDKALATMLHEFKHFADQQVYGDDDMPYHESQQGHFMRVKEALRKAVMKFREKREATANKIDKKMFKSIASIFEDYKPKYQDAEVLVKVPEIIGYLGVDNGIKWLEKNVPYLLRFYEFRFNPACKNYLATHGVEAYAELDAGKPKI